VPIATVPLPNPNAAPPGSVAPAPVYPQIQYLPSNGTIPASGSTPAMAISPSPATNPGPSNAVYYGSATANLAPPNIPGASSIVPMGPVTYLPGSSNPNASLGIPQVGVPQVGVPQAGVTQAGATAPGLANPVLPPSGATLDPEAARAPSWPPPSVTPPTLAPPTLAPPTLAPPTLAPPNSAPTTSSAGLWSDRDERVAKMSPMARLPVVAIDRPVANAAATYPTSRSVSNDPAAIASPFPGSSASNPVLSPTLPAYQPSTKTLNAKPLIAPEGFDGKPHWNPKLLPPSAPHVEDKVAKLSTASLK